MSLSPKVELTVEAAEQGDVFADMVRVAHCYREFSRAGQVICVYCNGQTLRAIARGMPKNRRGVIAMDLRCREVLGLKIGDVAEFQFGSADLLDDTIWAWNATDAMPRIAARLAIIGLALGLIGLFLGCVSLAHP